MRTYDVHFGEMPDPDAKLIDRLRSQFVADEPPAPGEALARMMAAGPTATSPRLETRRQNVLSKLLAQTGSKVAAALAGAALMLGALGATGALSGPMQMIFDSHDAVAACPEDSGDDEVEAPDETSEEESSEEAGGAVEEETELEDSGSEEESEVEDEECEDDGTSETAVAPSGEEGEDDLEVEAGSSEPVDCDDDDHGCWVSNAAKNKSTQCRNHGEYVSQVARAKGPGASDAFFDTNCDGELDEDEQAARDAARAGVAHDDDDSDDDDDKVEAKESKRQDRREAKSEKDRSGSHRADSHDDSDRDDHDDDSDHDSDDSDSDDD
jgi:hypothetical protein